MTDNNSSCRLVLSRTVSWEGFQASGTTGCETTLFMTENWQVSRGVVLIRDHLGDITARMVPQGVNQLTGKLRNGETLILVRN
ncbi:MAG: AprI/Inh family metalloprotease inhibitor [Cohaesibacteraceae bacterium]|nr:AprI/Inh family metalloprotease inhibitor [Cohaesibacteraceae bacterium]